MGGKGTPMSSVGFCRCFGQMDCRRKPFIKLRSEIPPACSTLRKIPGSPPKVLRSRASGVEMHVYEKLGVRRLINARSFSTKAGGCALPADVIEAIRQAAECCVRIDDLQDAASRVIARCTGAEAGIVTSGASAALTLGT